MQPIRTERTTITAAIPADSAALARYSVRNADHLSPWEPERPEGWHSESAWYTRLVANAAEVRAGRYLPLVARLHDETEIVAVANLSNIARGVFQACSIGFSVDAAHEGQGVMREVLEAALGHAFSEMGLNRVMANHLPENTRAAGVLYRLGFEQEGYARRYLKIAGVWRDHVLTARVASQEAAAAGAEGVREAAATARVV
ncbi:GNAT family N-acetyltransferase [Psychromarinibacter sp. C21-152]|uniref:GNAT family N-acetyltransferase n=1 Tax=Psychromarinibacter sediminicola TaxID=3033385 RepID=A0AAE3NS63_9RHOB|nr:GNAT family N-acetyltransferase [Psychromarinibacter sediminicola]MDF0601092.1 GNAT family N-acetyltransferase [Psychromarinibacter sediminicola]